MHDLEQSLFQEDIADSKENSPLQPDFEESTYKSTKIRHAKIW
jgi:hypothetical protein